ncbi:hypothetical protein B0H10DRAFT_1142668 [Mycena sp. CBHHK59/15]|nr:hypothetical protein B0H10DRAFT_1142668 [Mycena sp. CBHHK59/15]
MFAASAVLFISLLALTSEAIAKPLSFRREQALVRNAPRLALQVRDNNGSAVSFNNWKNISSLQDFDNFNGVQNFDGSRNSQTIVVKEVQTKCETVKIEIVQQKLAILREMAKRIITEQICEVETQTIVLAQHNGALEVFRDDVRRKTTVRQVGFDETVASKFNEVVNSDGSLSTDDSNFSGSDIGKNTVAPSGNNWDDSKSPAMVQAALDDVAQSINATDSSQ